jgi:hypothetical protein
MSHHPNAFNWRGYLTVNNCHDVGQAIYDNLKEVKYTMVIATTCLDENFVNIDINSSLQVNKIEFGKYTDQNTMASFHISDTNGTWGGITEWNDSGQSRKQPYIDISPTRIDIVRVDHNGYHVHYVFSHEK